MASWSKTIVSSTFDLCFRFSSPSSSSSLPLSVQYNSSSFSSIRCVPAFSAVGHFTAFNARHSSLYPSISKKTETRHICRAAEYKFPDPIPEFADAVSSLLALLYFMDFSSFSCSLALLVY